MKKVMLIITISFMILLTGCEMNYLSTSEVNELVESITEFIDYNKLVDKIHDESLDDVEISNLYVKDDFFNYPNKVDTNVELEYTTHYNAFSTLEFIVELIESIDEFNYDSYYQIDEFSSMISVARVEGVIRIDYYQYFEDLDMVSRQNFVLKYKEDKIYMERFATTLDLDTDTVLLHQKLSVHEDSNIETIEFIPETLTYTYIYNSYEDQEYFKYKGFFDDQGEYTRETVEMYLESESAFVSYDIKDNKFEDYRVKVFEDGHRVLKYDVNIFNSKETETEFTWNLLSVDNWVQVVNSGGENFLYHATGTTMDDYNISIQRDGYGKVIAYKMITGEVNDTDVSLNDYKLESNITLEQLEKARLAYIDVVDSKVSERGFILSNPVNKTIISVYFELYLESGKMSSFANEYK